MIGVISRAPVPQVSSSLCVSACVDMSMDVCGVCLQRDLPHPSIPPSLPSSLLPSSLLPLPCFIPRPTHSLSLSLSLSLCLSLSLSLSLSLRAHALPSPIPVTASDAGMDWLGEEVDVPKTSPDVPKTSPAPPPQPPASQPPAPAAVTADSEKAQTTTIVSTEVEDEVMCVWVCAAEVAGGMGFCFFWRDRVLFLCVHVKLEIACHPM